MGQQVSGRVKVKIDGELLRSKPGAMIQIGGIKRTPVPNDQGTVDWKEEIEPSEVKATISHVANTDLPAIRAWAGGVLTFETDSGTTYTVPSAFTAGTGELKDGEVEVTFNGDPAV